MNVLKVLCCPHEKDEHYWLPGTTWVLSLLKGIQDRRKQIIGKPACMRCLRYNIIGWSGLSLVDTGIIQRKLVLCLHSLGGKHRGSARKMGNDPNFNDAGGIIR